MKVSEKYQEFVRRCWSIDFCDIPPEEILNKNKVSIHPYRSNTITITRDELTSFSYLWKFVSIYKIDFDNDGVYRVNGEFSKTYLLDKSAKTVNSIINSLYKFTVEENKYIIDNCPSEIRKENLWLVCTPDGIMKQITNLTLKSGKIYKLVSNFEEKSKPYLVEYEIYT